MNSIENEIRQLKSTRGQEWAKGKINRNNTTIAACHTKINNLKAKLRAR